MEGSITRYRRTGRSQTHENGGRDTYPWADTTEGTYFQGSRYRQTQSTSGLGHNGTVRPDGEAPGYQPDPPADPYQGNMYYNRYMMVRDVTKWLVLLLVALICANVAIHLIGLLRDLLVYSVQVALMEPYAYEVVTVPDGWFFKGSTTVKYRPRFADPSVRNLLG